DQVTRRAAAACTACHCRSATTPTKSFLTTTFTLPGIPATEVSSTLTTFAPTVGGLTTLPCSMPGTRTCWTYMNSPVTFVGMSYRGTEVPSTLYCFGS